MIISSSHPSALPDGEGVSHAACPPSPPAEPDGYARRREPSGTGVRRADGQPQERLIIYYPAASGHAGLRRRARRGTVARQPALAARLADCCRGGLNDALPPERLGARYLVSDRRRRRRRRGAGSPAGREKLGGIIICQARLSGGGTPGRCSYWAGDDVCAAWRGGVRERARVQRGSRRGGERSWPPAAERAMIQRSGSAPSSSVGEEEEEERRRAGGGAAVRACSRRNSTPPNAILPGVSRLGRAAAATSPGGAPTCGSPRSSGSGSGSSSGPPRKEDMASGPCPSRTRCSRFRARARRSGPSSGKSSTAARNSAAGNSRNSAARNSADASC